MHQEHRLKLGIVIQHYDARNDVRELVDLLAKQHEVVLFAEEQAARRRGALREASFRKRLRLTDRFWLQVWNFFGALPASRNNFLVTELFKLAPLPPLRRAIAAARLRLRLRLPSLMSFDFLLDRLAGSDTTPVEDIDRFLVITELSSPRFLSTVLRAGKPVDAYVYSWDHACKHATFSKRIDRWLVWHEGIADDLVKLQGLPRERIDIVGATQLAYIHEYLSRPELRERRYPGRYVYYGCGVGAIEMARQEARLIGFLAETLQAVAPDVTLLVRPYPMLADTDFFRRCASAQRALRRGLPPRAQGPLAHAGCDFRAPEPAGAFAGVRALRDDDGAGGGVLRGAGAVPRPGGSRLRCPAVELHAPVEVHWPVPQRTLHAGSDVPETS
jgi:hypothetical protein